MLTAATLYTQPNFGGNNVGVEPGRYPDLSYVWLLAGHQLRSLRVMPGRVVTVYQGTNFTGSSQAFGPGDHPDLGTWKEARSLVVEQKAAPGPQPPPAPSDAPPAPVRPPEEPPPQGGHSEPVPPGPAPPGYQSYKPGDPVPPGAVAAPPPSGGASFLDPNRGYELYAVWQPLGLFTGKGLPLDVALAMGNFGFGIRYYLLGDEPGDAYEGFRLSSKALRIAAVKYPGQRPQDLGLPAWIAAQTLRGPILVGRRILDSISIDPLWVG
jgi:hypothetical protein